MKTKWRILYRNVTKKIEISGIPLELEIEELRLPFKLVAGLLNWILPLTTRYEIDVDGEIYTYEDRKSWFSRLRNVEFVLDPKEKTIKVIR